MHDIPAVGYVIPFKESIKRLLEITDVFNEISSSHCTTRDFMDDICDGNYIRSLTLFARNLQTHVINLLAIAVSE